MNETMTWIVNWCIFLYCSGFINGLHCYLFSVIQFFFMFFKDLTNFPQFCTHILELLTNLIHRQRKSTWAAIPASWANGKYVPSSVAQKHRWTCQWSDFYLESLTAVNICETYLNIYYYWATHVQIDSPSAGTMYWKYVVVFNSSSNEFNGKINIFWKAILQVIWRAQYKLK